MAVLRGGAVSYERGTHVLTAKPQGRCFTAATSPPTGRSYLELVSDDLTRILSEKLPDSFGQRLYQGCS